jgi:type VI secretion system protein ImpA
MASPPLLDADALLLPIPGENPAGEPISFQLRETLNESRKAIDPDLYPADDPMRPELRPADWPGIVRLAKEVLTGTSKDLLVAARLTEALVKLHGFAGARDGFRLLRQLVNDCWERLNPPIEDGDLEVRAAPFNWLDDPDLGARFPTTLRAVPLVAGENYAWQQWHQMQAGRGPLTAEVFERAVAATPREFCQQTVDDLAEARTELNLLTECLRSRLNEVAPGLFEVHKALEECEVLALQILERKGPAPIAEAEPSTEEASTEGPAVEKTGPGRRPTTRADVYAQLNELANVLQQMEPHSPIPYLIQKAVELGGLPFPQLMRALIRDENILSEMNRELGIKEPPPM